MNGVEDLRRLPRCEGLPQCVLPPMASEVGRSARSIAKDLSANGRQAGQRVKRQKQRPPPAMGPAAESTAAQHDGDVDLIPVLHRHGQLLRVRALEVEEDLDVSSQLPFLLEQRLTDSWILVGQVVKTITDRFAFDLDNLESAGELPMRFVQAYLHAHAVSYP